MMSLALADEAPGPFWLTGERVAVSGRPVGPAALLVAEGRIRQIAAEPSGSEPVVAVGRRLVMPGLIDLHTDALEKHLWPRKNVAWDPMLAALDHDRILINAGITTVADSLTIGLTFSRPDHESLIRAALTGLEEAAAAGLLRADHRLHLRMEITDPQILEYWTAFCARPGVVMTSLMDHSPGHRQSPDVKRFRDEYLRPVAGMSEEEADAAIEVVMERSRTIAREHFRDLAAAARARGLPLASHDDETPAHIAEAVAAGVSMAEFPTTRVAAEAARAAGLVILLGAPNLVRGRSSSGNVSVAELAAADLLDVLVSDYVPGALLQGMLRLTAAPLGWPLERAIATVTSGPADLVGLSDRGRIAEGLRADLLVVEDQAVRPMLSAVLVGGCRVG